MSLRHFLPTNILFLLTHSFFPILITKILFGHVLLPLNFTPCPGKSHSDLYPVTTTWYSTHFYQTSYINTVRYNFKLAYQQHPSVHIFTFLHTGYWQTPITLDHTTTYPYHSHARTLYSMNTLRYMVYVFGMALTKLWKPNSPWTGLKTPVNNILYLPVCNILVGFLNYISLSYIFPINYK